MIVFVVYPTQHCLLPQSCLLKKNIPMLICRKEGAKSYGTKNAVEGIFKKGHHCLIVEDVVTSGASVLQTAEVLRAEGIIVTDAVVLIDREQGAPQNLQKHGIKLHSIAKLGDLLHMLHGLDKIEWATIEQVEKFISRNQDNEPENNHDTNRLTMSLKDRCIKGRNQTARHLMTYMREKQTNLCVAVDLTSKGRVIALAKMLGPHICCLKLHADIIEDFDQSFVEKIVSLATLHKFLIFEDRKFGDIGNTARLQYTSGLHKIIDWAHIVTVHALPGDGVIKGLKLAAESKGLERGALLVAQMSSEGNLTSPDYVQGVLQIALAHPDFVTGFISQSPLSLDPAFIHFTPGVQFQTKSDNLSQQYIDPEEAIKQRGADVIIVGRGITQESDKNIVNIAIQYKTTAWKLLNERIIKKSK